MFGLTYIKDSCLVAWLLGAWLGIGTQTRYKAGEAQSWQLGNQIAVIRTDKI